MLAFVDETGDHDLNNIDPNYPLFGLGALVIEEAEYARLATTVDGLKQEFFGDAGFILHSNELRHPTSKLSDPRNAIVTDPAVRTRFYTEFDRRVIEPHEFKLILCFIAKRRMAAYYTAPYDPYHFSFENVLNRIISHGGPMNEIIAEKRSRYLDTELMAEYEKLSKTGIYRHAAETVTGRTSLRLVDKKGNDNGLQVIDLILGCLGRHYLGKTKKMIGNDLTPSLLFSKLPCPVTFFPRRRAES